MTVAGTAGSVADAAEGGPRRDQIGGLFGSGGSGTGTGSGGIGSPGGCGGAGVGAGGVSRIGLGVSDTTNRHTFGTRGHTRVRRPALRWNCGVEAGGREPARPTTSRPVMSR